MHAYQTVGGLLLTTVLLSAPATAADPYFVTYSHRMEEPGNLEFATRTVVGLPTLGPNFLGSVVELEYGLKGWWTTELYLDGQSTQRDSTLFTGYRWEHRVRLLPKEHWINPVLYFEFENLNGADRGMLEVVGHDGESDLVEPNAETRHEKKRELEAKLILGSNVHGWNITENFIVEKNVKHAPFEFGYSVGVSRPMALAARPDRCNICPENLSLGAELYGGLGTHDDFGLHDTSHYLAPTLAWTLANGVTFRVSPGFGLTAQSMPFLMRFGVSYEIAQFGRGIRQWWKRQ